MANITVNLGITFTTSKIDGAELTVDDRQVVRATWEGRWITVRDRSVPSVKTPFFRKIKSIDTNQNTLTLEYPFGEQIVDTVEEVTPPQISEFRLSTSFSRLVTEFPTTFSYSAAHGYTINTRDVVTFHDTYLGAENVRITLNASNLFFEAGSGIYLGDYVRSGGKTISINGCNIIDTNQSNNKGLAKDYGRDAIGMGNFVLFNCTWWQQYPNERGFLYAFGLKNNPEYFVWLVDSHFYGDTGLRYGGKNVFFNSSFHGRGITVSGLMNPISPTDSESSITDNKYGIYYYLAYPHPPHHKFKKIANVAWVVRLGTGNKRATTMKFCIREAELIAIDGICHDKIGASTKIEMGNYFSAVWIDATDGAVLGEKTMMSLTDNFSNEFERSPLDTGNALQKTFLPYAKTDASVKRLYSELVGQSKIKHYMLKIFSYGYEKVFFPLPMKVEFDRDVIFFPDHYISNKSVADVSAYTELDTLDNIYDFHKTLLIKDERNSALLDTLLSGDEKILTFNPDINVVIDKNAAQVFKYDAPQETVTIKTDNLVFGDHFQKLLLRGTGKLTLKNGAKITTTYEDVDGETVIEQEKITATKTLEIIKKTVLDTNLDTKIIRKTQHLLKDEVVTKHHEIRVSLPIDEAHAGPGLNELLMEKGILDGDELSFVNNEITFKIKIDSALVTSSIRVSGVLLLGTAATWVKDWYMGISIGNPIRLLEGGTNGGGAQFKSGWGSYSLSGHTGTFNRVSEVTIHMTVSGLEKDAKMKIGKVEILEDKQTQVTTDSLQTVDVKQVDGRDVSLSDFHANVVLTADDKQKIGQMHADLKTISKDIADMETISDATKIALQQIKDSIAKIKDEYTGDCWN